MRWKISTPGWTRWVTAATTVVATLAASANLISKLSADNHTRSEVVTAVTWLAVAVVACLAAFVWALAGSRRERIGRKQLLRVQESRVSKVDPMLIGVSAPRDRRLTSRYLPRTSDADLVKAIGDALSGGNRWIVEVFGEPTVGKTRTLFEALRRNDAQKKLKLVAPRNATALQKILDPTEGALKLKGRMVLWLDNIEKFLEGGLITQDLNQWRSSASDRIVVFTSGSHPLSVGRDVLAYLEPKIRRIELEKTSPLELENVQAQLSEAEFSVASNYGWAAYIIAADLLENKLIGRNVAEARSLEGIAVVHAAIDWARCGRTDPIPYETLSDLWRAYFLPGTPDNDDRFKAGLNWALTPVTAGIALLDAVDEGYRPNAFAVRVRSDREATAPRDDAWNAALRVGPPIQHLAVGRAAWTYNRARETETGLTAAATASAQEISTSGAAVAGIMLGRFYADWDGPEKAVEAFDIVVDRVRDSSDESMNIFGIYARIAKAIQLLQPGWPEPDGKREESIAVLGQIIDDCHRDEGAVLRPWAAWAKAIKMRAELGPNDDLTRASESRALAGWNEIIDSYYEYIGENAKRRSLVDPNGALIIPNPESKLRQVVAVVMFSRGYVLSWDWRRYWEKESDEDDREWNEKALEAQRQLIDEFSQDPDPGIRKMVQDTKLRKLEILRRSQGNSESLLAEANGALRFLEERLSRAEQVERPTAVSPAARRIADIDIARCLVNLGYVMGVLGMDLVKRRDYYSRVIKNCSDTADPRMQLILAQALINDGKCAEGRGDGLLDDVARSRYEKVINDYDIDGASIGLRYTVEEAKAALAELNRRPKRGPSPPS